MYIYGIRTPVWTKTLSITYKKDRDGCRETAPMQISQGCLRSAPGSTVLKLAGSMDDDDQGGAAADPGGGDLDREGEAVTGSGQKWKR